MNAVLAEVSSQEFSYRSHGGWWMRSGFVREVLWTYVTQIVSLLISLGTTVIVARTLGPSGRGEFAVATTIGLVGVQGCNLGLHASNTYLAAKRPHVLSSLLSNSLAAGLGIGGIVSACAWLVFHLRPQLAPIHGTLLVLGLTWVPLGVLYLLIQNLLIGIHQIRAYNVIELARRGAGIVFILGALLLVPTTPAHYFLAMLGSLLGGILLGLGWMKRFVQRTWEPSLALFREGFRMGARAYLAAFFAYLVIRSDLLMVKYLLGPTQAGYYSIAGSLADYILLLPAAIATVLFPKLSAVSADAVSWQWMGKAMWATCALLFPLVACAAFLAHPMIQTLFGAAYRPAAAAFILLMPGVFFLGVETVMVQYLNSLGFPLSVVWAWLATCALNIGANLWAIPHFGIAGASVVSSICYFMMFVLVWLILRKWKGSSKKVVTYA